MLRQSDPHAAHQRGLAFSSTSLGCVVALLLLQGTINAMAQSASKISQQLILEDSTVYTKGPFTAFIAPYNRGKLRPNLDYRENITLQTTTFPNASSISWRWPKTDALSDVKGFLAIDFGDYYNTRPERPIPSSRIKDLQTLSSSHVLALSGDTEGCSVIVNFFATKSIDPNSIVAEVEVLLHSSASARHYVSQLARLGTFRAASGVDWTASVDPRAAHGPDVLFVPDQGKDDLVGTVDMQAMLLWLVDHRFLTGEEFFNGLAIGVEPHEGAGSLNVTSLSVSYGTR